MPAEAASGGGDLDSGGARRFRTHVKCRVYFANVGMFVNVPRVCVEQAVGPSMPNKRGDAASAMGGERGQAASDKFLVRVFGLLCHKCQKKCWT